MAATSKPKVEATKTNPSSQKLGKKAPSFRYVAVHISDQTNLANEYQRRRRVRYVPHRTINSPEEVPCPQVVRVQLLASLEGCLQQHLC